MLSKESIEVTSLTLDTSLLKADELFIRVLATPINPLDLLKIQGLIKGVNYPFTPGSEGVGVVLHASDTSLLGRLVSFSNPESGCWR